MKYAASIRYGGQLIEASDSSYEDYKRLGLCCPECKAPVFLRGKSERAAAHFSHFKASDPAIVRQCEFRVSRYSQQDLEKKAAQARNQRLKLLQRWFWEILLKYSFREGSTKRAIRETDLLKRIKDEFPVVIFCEYFRQLITTKDVQKALDESILAINSEELGSERVRHLQERICRIEVNFHKLVCSEVVDFLKSRKNQSLLENVLACSFLMIQLSPKAQSEMENGNKWVPLTNAVIVICMVPWSEEFQGLDISIGRGR